MADIKTSDIVAARRKVQNECLTIIKSMNNILDIDNRVSQEIGVDFFNECLPLNKYPFRDSFDEVISKMCVWAFAMCDLNEKEIGVINCDSNY